MLTSYTYGVWRTDRKMIVAMSKDDGIPDLELVVNGETWVRISDTPLTCEPAMHDFGGKKGLVMTKCGGGWECHRTVLGVCQCGLHDRVQLARATV